MQNWFNIVVTWLAFMAAQSALSATITSTKKSKFLIKIDEGTASGYTKGLKACVYTTAGKKVGCGLVVKSTPDYAMIRIKSAKAWKQIRKGMTVNLEDASGKEATGEISVAKGGPDHRYNIKLGYLYTALAPSTFNKVTYNPPATAGEKVDTLWKKETAATSTLYSFFTEGEFGIGKSMALAIGLRYRNYGGFEAVSDYNTSSAELLTKFVEVTQTATAYGFYSDFTFLDVSVFRMSSGLDFDMSSIQFKATQKSDSGESNEIASYKSSMNIVSLRLGAKLNFLIGRLGLITPGVNLLVPLASMGGSTSSKVDDPQAAEYLAAIGQEAADADLKTTIDHKKASFGAEIVLATYFAF